MPRDEAGGAPVLSIEGLTVALPPGADRAHAVEDVSLSIRPGEILCVVGESGSGKSVTAFSTMRLLPRALRPVAGRIVFEGQDLLRAAPAAMRQLRGQRLSMIFQEPMTALSPVMTAGRLIEEPLRIHTPMPRAARQARVLELMRLVNLPTPEALLGRYAHELSGGQRQRVMIAMALALEPRLLIADEPTTALDVTTQAQILRLIRDIQRRTGMAVMFVTHDFGVVADIADRVAVMQTGRVVEEGTAEEVLGAPRHPYTRALLRAIPGPHARRRPPRGVAAPVLEAWKLSKTYARRRLFGRATATTAMQEVTIAVERGETVAVVGESGSGKSTLARCIARLVAPSEGTIRIEGRDVTGGAPRGALSRLVQMVFQDPNRSLNPRWTVAQSLGEGQRNLGTPAAEARATAAALLEKVGLPREALDRYPPEFSGGQRQRIALARALSMRPRLLIADEAVSALDVSVQAQVLALLDDIQRELGFSLLFITHDLRVAVQIADRIAVMHRGRLVEQGPALEVFASPRDPYTRQLFDSAPGHGRSWMPATA
jgi:peptide/nickel transport system ATP-binding protein